MHTACGILPGEQKRVQLVLGGTRCSKLLRATILRRLNRKHRKGGVVGEFAMRGDVCGSRAALYEGGFLLRMTQDTTVGGMRTPSHLE